MKKAIIWVVLVAVLGVFAFRSLANNADVVEGLNTTATETEGVDLPPDFKGRQIIDSQVIEQDNASSVQDGMEKPGNDTVELEDLNSRVKIQPVQGGNKNAVNILATQPSKARATVIENVDQHARDITPQEQPQTVEGQETTEDKERISETEHSPVDMRQFLHIKTASGKEFHIIVEHDKDGQEGNVKMLTEVSEQDLLNLIEGQSVADREKEALEEARQAEEKARKELEQKLKEKEDDEHKESREKSKGSGIGSWMYILLIVGILGMGFYFMKRKQNSGREEFDEEFEETEEE